MPKKLNPVLKYKIFKNLKKVTASTNKVYLAYVVGGIGAYFLGKFAYRYYKSHPEIAKFFKENYEQLGEKIKEIGGNTQEHEIPKH